MDGGTKSNLGVGVRVHPPSNRWVKESNWLLRTNRLIPVATKGCMLGAPGSVLGPRDLLLRLSQTGREGLVSALPSRGLNVISDGM